MQEELVDIINDQDEIIDVVPRSVMRKNLLPHRSTYILMLNNENRILVELRTLSKDYAPGQLDVCVGGVVQSGEEVDLSAQREVLEEVGVDCKQISFYALGKVKIPYLVSNGFVMAYLYLAKGNFITKRQESEVSAIMYLKPNEIEALSSSCTHDSLVAYREILQRAHSQNLIVTL